MFLLQRDAFLGGAFALAAIGAASLTPAPRVPEDAPQLVLPVVCEVGKNCLVQKLADHDIGPGRRDYRCGLLTTDGHDGVDIRLRTMEDMAQGYAVVAAAGGVVLRVRDGEPDISARQRSDRNGKDAGNGVVIDHGNGWESQYSHLKMGSVAVRRGQHVAAGTPIGLIGMSGNSEFPHLHFSLRHAGKPIDPFTAGAIPTACDNDATGRGLWSPSAARSLNYVPTAVITLGLASAVPPRAVAERSSPPPLANRMAPLLLWVDAIGMKDGDSQIFTIYAPDGAVAHRQESLVSGGGLSWFAYSGKRAPVGGWRQGKYRANYTVQRNGGVIINNDVSVDVR